MFNFSALRKFGTNATKSIYTATKHYGRLHNMSKITNKSLSILGRSSALSLGKSSTISMGNLGKIAGKLGRRF